MQCEVINGVAMSVGTRKILFYIDSICGGGAERMMSNLVNYFSDQRYEVTLLTSYKNENDYSISQKVKRINIYEDKIREGFIKKNFTRIRYIRRICRNDNIDALVSFMAAPNIRSLIATTGLRTRNIISVRVYPEIEYQNKKDRLAAMLLYPRTDGIVFQTEEARDWFPTAIKNNSVIIWNGVADSFYRVKRSAHPKNMISIGRLDKQKNFPLLIGAFKDIADEFPEEKLVIYGDGKEKKALEELIKSEGLAGKVLLEGQTRNVPGILQECKLFVLSSDYEGMPNALMEAMASGVPCISTDCPSGGSRAVIGAECNGILVPPGDRRELSREMKRLLSDKKEREEMGKHARERAEVFRLERVCREWKEYIDKILQDTA